MRFASSRNIYIRRTLTAVLVFLTALFQHSGFIPELFGAPAMVLIPLTVCIAMFERSIPGMCFGVLAGLLWDFAISGGDGFFSVMLTAVVSLSFQKRTKQDCLPISLQNSTLACSIHLT